MKHGSQLPLERCPHCNVAKPSLKLQWQSASKDHAGHNPTFWSIYNCMSCGGMTMARSIGGQQDDIAHIWPTPVSVSDSIPNRARDYLSQAVASISAQAGAVMLADSAIDSMLKDKGYKDGVLYSRIDAAAKDHLITIEMSAWAHEIRLDANDQRHADDSAQLPTAADANKAVEFASALAQFLYVLPARVERGRKP